MKLIMKGRSYNLFMLNFNDQIYFSIPSPSIYKIHQDPVLQLRTTSFNQPIKNFRWLKSLLYHHLRSLARKGQLFITSFLWEASFLEDTSIIWNSTIGTLKKIRYITIAFSTFSNLNKTLRKLCCIVM